MKSEIKVRRYSAVYPGASQLTFRRNMSPESSALKSKPGKKPPGRRQQAEVTLWKIMLSSYIVIEPA
jgi:hypothetical protein